MKDHTLVRWQTLNFDVFEGKASWRARLPGLLCLSVWYVLWSLWESLHDPYICICCWSIQHSDLVGSASMSCLAGNNRKHLFLLIIIELCSVLKLLWIMVYVNTFISHLLYWTLHYNIEILNTNYCNGKQAKSSIFHNYLYSIKQRFSSKIWTLKSS